MGEGTTTDFGALRARLATEEGPRLWRSLEELADVPEVRRYVEAEFPDIMQATHIDRRTLLRLMSASLALGGLTACNGNDAGSRAALLSQSHNIPGYVPGVPVTIATSLPLNGYGRGVLVKAQEGRPIKIEGNPLHPASLGATDVFAQAEILSLYDPDRSETPFQDGVPRSWDALTNFIRPVRNQLVFDEGRGLHVLMPPTSSPTLHRLIGQARQLFPHSQWHVFSPLDDGNRQAAAMAVFGRDVELVYDLTQADVIVTLGGDLFAEEPGHIRYAADYQARRRILDRGLPRLFAVETRTSLVGARADERIPLRPRDFEAFAEALAAALDTGAAPSGSHPAIPSLADALRRAGTRSLVAAGREQPARVHALALAINARLGPRTLHRERFGRSQTWQNPCKPDRSRISLSSAAIPCTPRPRTSTSARSCSACHYPFISASTRTRRLPSATGTFPRATRSKAGATCGPSTERSVCASRQRCG
jgi:molybdopterin-containing oxidoreductase family iron-sulfur binding subunit